MAGPRILHVDDEEDSLRQAKEYLEGEEIDGWGFPSVVGITEFAEAMAMLETQRFDLVILDVRLGGHEATGIPPEAEAGAGVLEEIKARRFVPVVFWTGLPERVRHLQTPFVRVLEKTLGGLDALARTVGELFDAGLPSVNRALLKFIEAEQRAYMWDFVAPNWEQLRDSADHISLAYMLARRLGHSLSRPGIEQLAKELGEAEAEGVTAGKVHPAEMYILPPVASIGPGVGDIYQGDVGGVHPGWWLVLTPTCDLYQKKAECVLLAECAPADDHQDVKAWQQSQESQSKRSKLGDLLTQKTGGQDDRDLYLPGVLALPDLVADLQRTVSIPRDDLAEMRQVASLDSPFAEALVSRFIRYFGRVGTPDLDADFLIQRFRTGGARG
jgi:CheY-like chemotaxis protein